MARPRSKRPPSVEPFLGTDARWHAFVPVGDGRRHRTGKTYEECADKVRHLDAQLAVNQVAPVGRASTVARYLVGWLGDREGDLRYATIKSYGTAIREYLVPQLGPIKLDQLHADHIRAALKTVEAAVSAQAAHKAHRVLRSALSDAWRHGLVPSNAAKLVRPPRIDEDEVIPLTLEHAQAILAAVEGRPNAARWDVALSLGLRQGETLALRWYRPDEPRLPSDVDLDAGTLTVREKLIRKSWRHGCDEPSRCGHARSCPQRYGGGLVTERPKSRAGERSVALPAPTWDALRVHRRRQLEDKAIAGSKWRDLGYVFAGPFGGPIDPRRDWAEWHAILDEAQVPPARLHDARHTAATFLLVKGVDKRVVMEIMGWSQTSLADRYQHAVGPLLREAADRMGELLTGSATKAATKPSGRVRELRPKAL